MPAKQMVEIKSRSGRTAKVPASAVRGWERLGWSRTDTKTSDDGKAGSKKS